MKKSIGLSIILGALIIGGLFALVWMITHFYQPFHILNQIISGETKLLIISLLILITSLLTTGLSEATISFQTPFKEREYLIVSVIFWLSYIITNNKLSMIYFMELLIFFSVYCVVIYLTLRKSQPHGFIVAYSLLTVFHFINMLLFQSDSLELMMRAFWHDILGFLFSVLIAVIIHEVFLSKYRSMRQRKVVNQM